MSCQGEVARDHGTLELSLFLYLTGFQQVLVPDTCLFHYVFIAFQTKLGKETWHLVRLEPFTDGKFHVFEGPGWFLLLKSLMSLADHLTAMQHQCFYFYFYYLVLVKELH